MEEPEIRAALQRLGLERITDRILAQVRPCIRLVLGKPGAGPVGGSRVGGQPDAPAGADWPLMPDGEPMTFVLQLALSDPALPLAGTLALFLGTIDGGYNVPHRFWLIPRGTELRPLAPPGSGKDDLFGNLPVHGLKLVPGLDLPGWYSLDYDAVVEGLSEDECNIYGEEIVSSLEPEVGRPVLGKLLGHVAGIGSDPREDAIVWDEAPDRMYDSSFTTAIRRRDHDGHRQRQWTALLVVDSCDDLELCIGDAGYLQFLVEGDKLALGDLTRAYGQIESS